MLGSQPYTVIAISASTILASQHLSHAQVCCSPTSMLCLRKLTIHTCCAYSHTCDQRSALHGEMDLITHGQNWLVSSTAMHKCAAAPLA